MALVIIIKIKDPRKGLFENRIIDWAEEMSRSLADFDGDP